VAGRKRRRAAGLTAAAGMMFTTPDVALAADAPVEEAMGHDAPVEAETAYREEGDEMAELITQLREDAPEELDPLFDTLADVFL
jgi:hypothetical protein